MPEGIVGGWPPVNIDAVEGPAGDDRETRLAAELIEGGGETLGAVAGGALGTIGGPVGIAIGAVGGVAVTRVVTRLGAELYERLLAPRQRARAGVALGVAVVRMHERSESGQPVRADAFFEPTDDERAPAEELLEGVLLQAANAYQERKVPYMGNFFASVAYSSDVSPAYAHMLLRIAEQLTYRQLVALSFFAENESSDELMTLTVRRDEEGPWMFADGLGRELNELGGDLGLLGVRQSDGEVQLAYRTWGSNDFEGHELTKVALTDLGGVFYELMGLSAIPEEEKREILGLMERVA